MNEMRILGPEGDIKKIWNPDSDLECKEIEKEFDRLVKPKIGKAKFTAFRVDEDGEKSTKMVKFDKTAGKIIMVPIIAGG